MPVSLNAVNAQGVAASVRRSGVGVRLCRITRRHPDRRRTRDREPRETFFAALGLMFDSAQTKARAGTYSAVLLLVKGAMDDSA